MTKNQKIFLLWFILVVAWNFSVPEARPIYDVMVAAGLSFLSHFLTEKF